MARIILQCFIIIPKSKKLWCFYSFLLFFGWTHAQTTKGRVSLITILEKIQNQFPYTFTYADDVVSNKILYSPPNTISFEEILIYLEKETGLVFTKIDTNFVSIKPKNRTRICGYIKNNEDKFPIKDCLIKAKNQTVTTNEDGYFELVIDEEREIITIQSAGFEITYKPSHTFDSTCKTLYLSPSIELLPEIVLKNYLTVGIDKTYDGNFLIDLKKFAILPGLTETDVLKTVQALPGVQSVNERVSDINIRGGTHDQNLILWDGIKMYQSGHFFGLISVFDPNSTQTVGVIKNGTKAEYSDGISGTILMQTDNQVNSKFSGSWSIDQINTSSFLDIPLGKNSSLQISGRKSINEFVTTKTYSQYFKRTLQNTEIANNDDAVTNSDIQFDFYDTSLRWLLDISKNDRIRVNFIHINNSLNFTETANIKTIDISKKSTLSQNSIAAGLFYKRKWNTKLRTIFSIYDTNYLLKSVNVNILDELQFVQENKIAETSIKAKTSYDINSVFSWNSGYQWTETGLSNNNELGEQLFKERRTEVVRIHALFSSLHYESNSKKTIFTTGIRYNYNEKFNKHILEPRWSFYQKLLEHWKLELSGEFKNQHTSHNINFQTDFLGIEKRRWVLSNDNDIPILKSKQVSLSLHYDKKGWLLSTEGYYKNVKGITTKSQGFLNQYSTINELGSYTTYGIDVLINKSIRNFRVWSNYMWAKNNYIFENLLDTNFPNTIDIRHAVTLGTSYTKKSFNIALGLNWRSALPTTRPLSENAIITDEIKFRPAHSSRITNYLRYDISATYAFLLRKGVKIHSGFSVWNFLNKENILKEYYKRNAQDLPQKELERALDITPNIFLKIAF